MRLLINDGQPFTTALARSLGWTRKELEQAVSTHHLRRALRGVYVDHRVPDTREHRLAAIALVAPPHAVACNETAAWVMGVDTFKPSQRHLLTPSFLVPHGSSRIRRTDVNCRQAKISPDDVWELSGSLLTTSLRTTTDLLRTLYRPYALAAADGMARVRLVSADDVAHATHVLKGYPGILQARELSMLINPAAASPGESWQRLRLIDAGMPPPLCQFEVVDAFGRSRFLDHAYPEVKVAVEFDGRDFHTDPIHREQDGTRRDHLIDALGWRFVISRREDIFGPDPTFEREVGQLIGVRPRLPRRWGTHTLLHAAEPS